MNWRKPDVAFPWRPSPLDSRWFGAQRTVIGRAGTSLGTVRSGAAPTLPPPDPDRPSGPGPTDPEGPTDPKPTDPTDPTGPDEPPACAPERVRAGTRERVRVYAPGRAAA
ncbi:hypothetical protein ACNTMW_12695 [Planosporangium sp. 12N6]|uniref:hypothetical protein n=1 Tax=Planosporangium spinosum TaxID=3402278 RepID=UPI003CF48A84